MPKNFSVSGRKLAALRDSKRFTQEELAQLIGVSKGAIARIEPKDAAGMLLKNFRKLAEVWGMSLDELAGKIGADEPPAAGTDPAGLEIVVRENGRERTVSAALAGRIAAGAKRAKKPLREYVEKILAAAHPAKPRGRDKVGTEGGASASR